MKRPILYVLIPFAIGIALSPLLNVSPLYIFLLSALFFIYSLISSARKPSHLALYLAIVLFGVFFYRSSTILPGDHISRFASDDPMRAYLEGTISDDPVATITPYNKIKTTFVLNVDAIKEGESWRASTGRVNVSVYSQSKGNLSFGQKVVAEGSLSKPSGLKNPGSFDYPRYLSLKDIYAVFRVKDGSAIEILSDRDRNRFKGLAYRVRNWMRSTIDNYLEMPYSGFIKAIMIGDRTDLKYSLNDDFIRTGTVHAIAISGLNVGLIAAIFLALFRIVRMPKKPSLILVAGILVLYAFIAGSSPPIVRAVIIFVIFVAGYLIDRESDMLNSLAFTAFMMLLVNPKELFDPSFQLSFVSIAGMIIFSPPINAFLRADAIKSRSFIDKTRRYLLGAISVSIAASLATWPIVAAYFNIVSPIALLANLVVVPALFVLTVASFLLMLASLFSAALAAVVAIGLSFICKALFSANHVLANIPWAYFRTSSPSKIFMMAYYASIVLLVSPAVNVPSSSPDNGLFRPLVAKRTGAMIIIALILNVLVWRDALSINRDLLRITFIDVGQGDSALVELPGGRNILIDAGPGGDGERFDAARAAIAPYLWNRGIARLDALVLTHSHEDHLGGAIYILDNFKVDRVIDSGAAVSGSDIFDRYLRAVRTKNIPREHILEGDSIRFSGGEIFALNPKKEMAFDDSNENSIVLKLKYKKFSALFCADASGSALERLTDSYGEYLSSNVIKIPHHGGDVGNANIVSNFFKAARANIAVISVAKMNKYRLPSRKTLSIISAVVPVIYETKDNGAVVISVCGIASYVAKPYLKTN